jgi:glycosyltransferase involved in cell wall biosynthesis
MALSALIPTYNRRNYVLRAIDSVLAQTVASDEIIVVDDGSTDGTAAAIEQTYGHRVKLIHQEHGGVSLARRRAVLQAGSEWVAFLDSDDEWLTTHNADLLQAAVHAPADVAWIFGDLRLIYDDGEGPTVFQKYGLRTSEGMAIFDDPLVIQFPFQFSMLPGSLIRRGVLITLGCFEEGLLHSEDVLAGYQVAAHFRFAAIPSVVARVFCTAGLKSSSASHSGCYSPDYYRARMAAYALVAGSGASKTWGERYANEVRGLCKCLADRGQPFAPLLREQFRYCTSMKSLAFGLLLRFGRAGLIAWRLAARACRSLGLLPPCGAKA